MTKLTCIIAGGRDFNNYEALKEAIKKSKFDIGEVVSGGAKGADALGERWAKENSISLKIMKADWDDISSPFAIIAYKKDWNGNNTPYNKAAGFIRNEDMARYALKSGNGACILLPGGNGTANMLKLAKEYKLEIFVHNELKKGNT